MPKFLKSKLQFFQFTFILYPLYCSPDACAEAHITEEWFHGKVDREVAKTRLLESAKCLKLNGNSSNNGK
jgi:hypothetical protein